MWKTGHAAPPSPRAQRGFPLPRRSHGDNRQGAGATYAIAGGAGGEKLRRSETHH